MALSKELKPYLVLCRYLNCLLKASMILFEISSLKTFNPNILRSVSQMLTAWAEQAEKYRSGEISKEQYDEWRYTYPEKDTTQPWRRFRAQFSLMPYCSAAVYFVS